MPELSLTVDVDAPAPATWEALVDWERQSTWIPLTTVRTTPDGGVEAYTGLGPIGFLDTMTIDSWDPPRRCVVRHTGRVVRGAGAFEVVAVDDGSCRVVWTEWLELPGGLAGQLAWALSAPLAAASIRAALRRFAASVAA